MLLLVEAALDISHNVAEGQYMKKDVVSDLKFYNSILHDGVGVIQPKELDTLFSKEPEIGLIPKGWHIYSKGREAW